MFEIVEILIMCFVVLLPNGDVTCSCEHISKPPTVMALQKERPKKPATRLPNVRRVF